MTCANAPEQGKVAALFVEPFGCYVDIFDLGAIDPWDEQRDARRYAGPYPVVAHPPCGTWGNFARSGMTLRPLGDDDGCFAAALAAVRRFGGVLEHPANSAAWAAWGRADTLGGWTCAVDQGHFGHRARKPTWLYACRTARPALPSGPAAAAQPCEMMSHRERTATPAMFRELLISLARSVYVDKYAQHSSSSSSLDQAITRPHS
jgi:hypothetical protein